MIHRPHVLCDPKLPHWISGISYSCCCLCLDLFLAKGWKVGCYCLRLLLEVSLPYLIMYEIRLVF